MAHSAKKGSKFIFCRFVKVRSFQEGNKDSPAARILKSSIHLSDLISDGRDPEATGEHYCQGESKLVYVDERCIIVVPEE